MRCTCCRTRRSGPSRRLRALARQAGSVSRRLGSSPARRWAAGRRRAWTAFRSRCGSPLHGGVPVGVGMVAVSDGWCGIYGMATHPGWRRRRVGSAVLRAGARWASGAGAARLFLQVEAGNPGARRCYEALGFAPSHVYHYRVR
ncbi:GNAT family N-acetyltransferase [Saccharopolyspora hattusasensis]|uniref:GNAT family N-acetyltransferase n=1 Tax=Saccharopolyspora hattusasensis TaxID=1128679 RepID=UPI003D96350C